MKLIVGLGNPGKEYENTRHNIGFMMLDYFTSKSNIEITKEKFNGLYGDTIINDEKVIFLKPLSYMNLSGEVVKKYVDFFKIDINDVLIIHDDLDLPIGTYRLKQNGSSGGHNGLKNIELNLGTQEYKRIKVGISNNKMMDTKDYVLGKFSKEDIDTIKDIEKIVASILNDYFKLDYNSLMNKYNHK